MTMTETMPSGVKTARVVLWIQTGFGLFGASFLGDGRHTDLRRSGLIVFAVTAFVTIPAFVSGIGAQQMLAGDPAVSAVIERHEGSALLTLWVVEITGALALIGLWQSYVGPHPARPNLVAILLCSIVSMGLLARTGNTGGDIRHPEVGRGQNATVVEGTIGGLVHALEPTPDELYARVVESWRHQFDARQIDRLDFLADGRLGRMVAIRDGKYAETSLLATGVAARRVDVEKMYNVERFRPRYDGRIGRPLLLVGLGG